MLRTNYSIDIHWCYAEHHSERTDGTVFTVNLALEVKDAFAKLMVETRGTPCIQYINM